MLYRTGRPFLWLSPVSPYDVTQEMTLTIHMIGCLFSTIMYMHISSQLFTVCPYQLSVSRTYQRKVNPNSRLIGWHEKGRTESGGESCSPSRPMSVACQQLFDRHKIPLATSTLSLYLEFDLTDVPDHASLRAKDHQAACDEACRVSGLRPPSVVVARALTTHKAGDIEEAHSLPYYSDPWLTDPAHEIRIEFLYR